MNLLLRDYVISRVLQCCKKSGADLLDIPEKLRFRYRRIKIDAMLEAAELSEKESGSSWRVTKTRANKTIATLFKKLYMANIIDEWTQVDESGEAISTFNRDGACRKEKIGNEKANLCHRHSDL